MVTVRGFSRRSAKQEPDHAAVFPTWEHGYDRNGAAAYIARLHQEQEAMAKKYKALQKEHALLMMQSEWQPRKE